LDLLVEFAVDGCGVGRCEEEGEGDVDELHIRNLAENL
jgi:hypothetical protein